MTEGQRNLEVQALLDHHEIVEVLTRYAVALDANDWKALEDVFVPHAVADYGDPDAVNDGLDAIIRACHNALGGLDSSQHIVTNFAIRVLDGEATSECYLRAQHYLVSASGGNTFEVGGTYRDQLVHTSQGWRIVHRVLEQTWTEGNANIFAEGALLLEQRGALTR
jgi:hypothetical protein